MSKEGMRTVMSLAILCLALEGLHLLFKHWNAEIAQPAIAESKFMEAHYIGVVNTNVFHRRDCPVITTWRLPGVPVLRSGIGPIVIFNNRQDALDEGYVACGRCNP